jgi:hypothetical protein
MPDVQMPRYQSHKKVWALKIAAIEFAEDGTATIAPAEQGFAPFKVSNYSRVFLGNDVDDLGYYVRYEGGYESWSPTKAFEEGYTPIF